MADQRLTPEGYDKEEEYFHRKNMELLENVRKQLDKARAAAAQAGQAKSHWMVCPKCGAKLKEVELSGVKVEQCAGCGGLFFDKGELELLTRRREGAGLAAALKGLFGG